MATRCTYCGETGTFYQGFLSCDCGTVSDRNDHAVDYSLGGWGEVNDPLVEYVRVPLRYDGVRV